MMNKEFCTYEQALALKELGFDEHCFGYYADKTGEDKTIYTVGQVQGSINSMSLHFNSGCSSYQFSAPLKQQAFRWFRENYDLQYWLNDGGMLGKCFIKITGYKHDKFYFSSSEPMEYEEAEEACLDKLIEIVKNK